MKKELLLNSLIVMLAVLNINSYGKSPFSPIVKDPPSVIAPTKYIGLTAIFPNAYKSLEIYGLLSRDDV